MNDLDKYYSILFKRANFYEIFAWWLEIVFIATVITSSFLNNYLLYVSAIGALVLQIAIYILGKQQKSSEALAHKLQEYAMLYSFYKKDTFNFGS